MWKYTKLQYWSKYRLFFGHSNNGDYSNTRNFGQVFITETIWIPLILVRYSNGLWRIPNVCLFILMCKKIFLIYQFRRRYFFKIFSEVVRWIGFELKLAFRPNPKDNLIEILVEVSHKIFTLQFPFPVLKWQDFDRGLKQIKVIIGLSIIR